MIDYTVKDEEKFMNLVKEKWLTTDKNELLDYLKSLGNSAKTVWAQNMLKTPSPVLVISTANMVKVAQEIFKGNYLSFLDLKIDDYYETIALYGMILSRIKDINTYLVYLDKYLDLMNCWAHCDLLTFPLLSEYQDTYLNLSKQFCNDQRVMVRRLSLFILFQSVKDEAFLKVIFDALLKFKDETEYYVIMMAGWLLSECIIRYQEPTLKFLTTNTLNKKIQNKAIQKCRESNRLSSIEKDFLLQYKVK